MGSYEYLLNQLVKYMKKYPNLISEIMILHQSYKISKVGKFFEELDLTEPYAGPPEHTNYIKYENEIRKIIERPDAFSVRPDALDQDYMDDESSRRTYSEASGVYEDVVEKYWRQPREMAMSWVDPQPGETILEIGIGPGSNFEYYPSYCEVTGIDLSEGMITSAERTTRRLSKNIVVLAMDAHKMTFPDDSFDKVYCYQSLNTVRNPLIVLKEIKRVCRGGGRVVMYEGVKSEVEEVAIIEYLFQPVGREMGLLWREDFPAYVAPYNSYFDLFAMLERIGLSEDRKKVFDPPFNIINLVQCTNEKGAS